MEPLRVFIGWDSREPEAYEVAAHSVRRHSSIPLDIQPLKQHELRAADIYQRPAKEGASTEFTYTRFLVPHLCGFEGRAVFFDCDFLWLADIAEMMALVDPAKAVSCVKHDMARFMPTTKMDGQPQVWYPRKNWSSLMVFNCGHFETRNLCRFNVNWFYAADYLHQMKWANDASIGELPEAWNWLEGYCPLPDDGPPKAIHFTTGGPWFERYKNVMFADLWNDELTLVRKEQ